MRHILGNKVLQYYVDDRGVIVDEREDVPVEVYAVKLFRFGDIYRRVIYGIKICYIDALICHGIFCACKFRPIIKVFRINLYRYIFSLIYNNSSVINIIL